MESNPFDSGETSPKFGQLAYEPTPAPQQTAQPVLASDAPVDKKKSKSCCSLAFYQRFFNVNTGTLLIRMLLSVLFCGPPFYRERPEDAEPDPSDPDLYGPFWITSTLVFAISAIGNIHQSKGYFDVERLYLAACTFYIALIVPPLIIWGALRIAKQKKSLVAIISLYGYSFTIYFIMACFTFVPIKQIGLICTCIAAIVSSLFLLKELFFYFQSSSGPQSHENRKPWLNFLLLGVILATHCVLAFITWFWFFKNYDQKDDDNDGK